MSLAASGAPSVPDDNRFQIRYRFLSRSCSNSAIDWSSTPAAPLLALTLWNASHTTHLEMVNDLSCCFGSLTRLLPATSTGMPVDRRTNPGNPSPSLHPHYQASTLLRDGPPACPTSVLRPSQFPLLGALPLADRSNTRPTVSGRGVPTFHTSA